MGTPITGSKLPIARECAWWARDDVEYPQRPRGDAASNGVRMHDAFASFIEHKVFPPLTPAQQNLANHMRSFWGQRILASGWRTEVAYALNPSARTARAIGKDIGRDYIKHGLDPSCEIGLTVDYVWIEEKGIPICGDWKTGYAAHVEPPESNFQLLGGGCAVTLAGTGSLDAGCYLEIGHVAEDGVYPKRFFASKDHLSAALREIDWLFRNRATAEAKAGDHCRWCPALGACPETGRAVVSAAASYTEERKVPTTARARFTTEFVSKENDALLVEEIAGIKKMVDAVEAALKERARASGGVLLPSGKLYKPVLCRRTALDKERVEEFLGDQLPNYMKTTEYEQFKVVKS